MNYISLDISNSTLTTIPDFTNKVSEFKKIVTIIASNNNLVTLEYVPETVNYLNVNNNPTLTSLITLPLLNNITVLFISNCFLTNLDYIPNLINNLDISFNFIANLQSLENCADLKTLNASNNLITDCLGIPSSITELNLSNNQLTNLNNLIIDNIRLININNNLLLDNLSPLSSCTQLEKIYVVNISNTTDLSVIPACCKTLYCNTDIIQNSILPPVQNILCESALMNETLFQTKIITLNIPNFGSNVTNSTWTAILTFAFPGFLVLPLTRMSITVKANENHHLMIRVQDITNFNLIVESSLNTFDEKKTILLTNFKNIPYSLSTFEIQVKGDTVVNLTASPNYAVIYAISLY